MPDPSKDRTFKYNIQASIQEAGKPVGGPLSITTVGNDPIDNIEYQRVDLPAGIVITTSPGKWTLAAAGHPLPAITNPEQVVALAIVPIATGATPVPAITYRLAPLGGPLAANSDDGAVAPLTPKLKAPAEIVADLVGQMASPTFVMPAGGHIYAGPAVPWLIKVLGATPLVFYNLSPGDSAVDIIIGRQTAGAPIQIH
jgi:hypothetical protein